MARLIGTSAIGVMMKTISTKPHEVQRAWHVIDANEQVLGRLASRVATILRGKHKPTYTPHVDTGDYVVIINAEKIKVTGNKAEDKIYNHHSGYPGGIKSINFNDLMVKDATRALEFAIHGMMPKGPLGRQMARKLKIYAGAEHPHEAQQPQALITEMTTTEEV
jgi:large subunit ribosomal protein L13